MTEISIFSQNRPAGFGHAVYLCVDAKFFPFALFLANQIATKYPGRRFDLCLISAEILPDHPLVKAHDIRLLRIDSTAWASRLPSDDRISFAAYLRIMAPRLLAQDYERMLYLDADIFYQRGDLNRLLALDLQNRPVGAVRDMIQLRQPDRRPADFAPFKVPFAKYFNSGVMVIDTALWNQRQLTERALDFAARNAPQLMAHDQTALNVMLRGDWSELSLVWNFEYNHQTMYFAAMFDVCLFHFVGRRKPFTARYGGFPRRFTDEYRAFFSTAFPEMVKHLQDGLAVRSHTREHVQALLFHLVNFKRFLPNDDRFQSDWDVLL